MCRRIWLVNGVQRQTGLIWMFWKVSLFDQKSIFKLRNSKVSKKKKKSWKEEESKCPRSFWRFPVVHSPKRCYHRRTRPSCYRFCNSIEARSVRRWNSAAVESGWWISLYYAEPPPRRNRLPTATGVPRSILRFPSGVRSSVDTDGTWSFPDDWQLIAPSR